MNWPSGSLDLLFEDVPESLQRNDVVVHRAHGWRGWVAYRQGDAYCVVWFADAIHSGWTFSLQSPKDLVRPLDQQNKLFEEISEK